MSFFSELRRRNVIRVAIAYSVTGWLVAQVAELALESFGAPGWVMKTLLLFLVLGLPFALIFAWAFELTPQGIKRERDVDRSQSITQETGRKLNYAIIGVLVVALGISVTTHRWTTGEPDAAEASGADGDAKSIAVLPFVNMSDDPNNEYFSDGISEELLNVLVKVEGLRVASRTSSFSFKDKDTPIPEIAKALQVEHVLEGSVRKAGDTVRVTAQLIDVRTDSHLWSETYDRKLEDIFVIQDEISAHIVDALKIALGAGEVVQTYSQPTQNLAAYEDYLRGRHFWQRRGADNIRRAIELFTRATEADPTFARAWSSLGAAHLTTPTYANEPHEDHHPLALKYSRKALALDPNIAEAHAVLADLLRYDLQWEEAEEHYRRAIELEPKNSTGYLWYAEQLVATGRREAALDNSRKAFELDPFNPGANSLMAYAYELNGDTEQAIRYLMASADLGHPGSPFALIDMHLGRGDHAAALQTFEGLRHIMPPEDVEGYELYLAAHSNADSAEQFLKEEAEALGAPEFWMALEHVRLGQVDKGIELAIETSPDGSEWMDVWASRLAPLRRHPRFGELVRAGRLDVFWDTVGWPSQCSRDGERITCD